ncbi:hypothetical protein NDI43_07770 [Microcoleus vaginatus GB2-A3]|uniref:hypothetical protein n=1 Tax=Microcoleus vaginatus TaxID=119532 RepID=UPI0032A470CA
MVKKYQEKHDRHLDETFNNRWLQRFFVALFLGGQVLLRILQGKIDCRKIMEHLVTVGLDSFRSLLLIAFFGDMIFTFQSARELVCFGAVGAMGDAFAVAFCDDAGPRQRSRPSCHGGASNFLGVDFCDGFMFIAVDVSRVGNS